MGSEMCIRDSPNPPMSILQPSGDGVIPLMSDGLDPNDVSLDLEPIPLNDTHSFSTPTPPPAQQTQHQPRQQAQQLDALERQQKLDKQAAEHQAQQELRHHHPEIQG